MENAVIKIKMKVKIKKLVIATGNQGKYKEFCELGRDIAEEIIFAPEIANLIIEETGKSYYENAFLKAKAWSEKINLPDAELSVTSWHNFQLVVRLHNVTLCDSFKLTDIEILRQIVF